MKIKNAQVDGNWALTPIDHVDVGIRQEPEEQPEYNFHPDHGYLPTQKDSETNG